jgi:hypothetical protein
MEYEKSSVVQHSQDEEAMHDSCVFFAVPEMRRIVFFNCTLYTVQPNEAQYSVEERERRCHQGW